MKLANLKMSSTGMMGFYKIHSPCYVANTSIADQLGRMKRSIDIMMLRRLIFTNEK